MFNVFRQLIACCLYSELVFFQLLERALEASGNDVDIAIKYLNNLHLEPEHAELDANNEANIGIDKNLWPSCEGINFSRTLGNYIIEFYFSFFFWLFSGFAAFALFSLLISNFLPMITNAYCLLFALLWSLLVWSSPFLPINRVLLQAWLIHIKRSVFMTLSCQILRHMIFLEVLTVSPSLCRMLILIIYPQL